MVHLLGLDDSHEFWAAGTRTSLWCRRISEFSWTSLLYDRFRPNKWVESLSSKHVSFLKSNATKTERKTNACVKFREEISAHVLVDDAILKDIQKKLEKLDMLDKINNQLSTIKHDITNIKSNVTEFEKGLNAVNDDVAEMK